MDLKNALEHFIEALDNSQNLQTLSYSPRNLNFLELRNEINGGYQQPPLENTLQKQYCYFGLLTINHSMVHEFMYNNAFLFNTSERTDLFTMFRDKQQAYLQYNLKGGMLDNTISHLQISQSIVHFDDIMMGTFDNHTDWTEAPLPDQRSVFETSNVVIQRKNLYSLFHFLGYRLQLNG